MPSVKANVKLPKQAPRGIDELSWRGYLATIRQVGMQRARQPYPDNPFWKYKVNKKMTRPRGRAPKGKEWDDYEGWVDRNEEDE